MHVQRCGCGLFLVLFFCNEIKAAWKFTSKSRKHTPKYQSDTAVYGYAIVTISCPVPSFAFFSHPITSNPIPSCELHLSIYQPDHHQNTCYIPAHPPSLSSIYISIYLSICPTVCLSIRPSVHSSAYLPTYLPTHLSIYSPTYLPTYRSTHLPTYPPIYPLTYLPTHLSIHSPTFLPTYLSTHLPTYPPICLLTYLPTFLFSQSYLKLSARL